MRLTCPCCFAVFVFWHYSHFASHGRAKQALKHRPSWRWWAGDIPSSNTQWTGGTPAHQPATIKITARIQRKLAYAAATLLMIFGSYVPFMLLVVLRDAQ